VIASGAPVYMQKIWPTRAAVDAVAEEELGKRTAADANDMIYYTNASRNYNPSPKLETITAQVMWLNSADDFINPPELGIAEREAKRLKNGRFILLPITDDTRGHGTHTIAKVWQSYLEALLATSAR
jgi:homoserine O-acetyltransferase